MPQMVRGEWLNLNGVWEFAETDDGGDALLGAASYPDKITVPFCRESKLSGLERKGFVKNVWYRRTFQVPADWKSPRIRLHVGACDWRTRVFVNGQLAGMHTGGSAPFAFDITRLLQTGDNTVIIHAFDDTASGKQACGKQSQKPESHGCVYTRTTGIWQTVWLEGVGATYVSDYFVTPTPDGRIQVRVETDGPEAGVMVQVEASALGKAAGTASAPANGRAAVMEIALTEKHLWTVADPFLYDLKVSVTKDGETLDTLAGYFGLRTISIQGAAYLINGQPVFQRLVLDQGFYPDGIWTAPSDADLRRDIELSQAAGFNGARLHQKAFEPRLLYWADKMGYLVWGEFPNWGANLGEQDVDLPIVDEWVELVRRDRNHPALIGWCPFNETPKTAVPVQNTAVYVTRQVDPTRPVLDTSGWVHGIADPQLLDAHDYNQNPEAFRAHWFQALGDSPLPPQYGGAVSAFVPFFVSEYGGIGWNLDGKGWGYGNIPKTLEDFYARFQGLTDALLDNPRMFAYCYTQLTDIEQEQNGLYTYDRKPKFDMARLHAVQTRAAAYESNPPLAPAAAQASEWRVLVGAAPDEAQAKAWRYTTEKPGNGWNEAGFHDAKWDSGPGGFGEKGGSEKFIKTPWKSKDIWLRQAFEYDGEAFDAAMLAIHYDNATEVYVNGAPIWSGTNWNDAYAAFDVTEAFRKALKPGKNVIAVHCHQDDGGQFIDVGLLVR